ncbi:MAG: hypothetical protein ACOYNI_12610 [Acidimicrobiia bacterium]
MLPRPWRTNGSRWLAFLKAYEEFQTTTGLIEVPALHPLARDAQRLVAFDVSDYLSDEHLESLPNNFFDYDHGSTPSSVGPVEQMDPISQPHSTREREIRILTGVASVDEVLATDELTPQREPSLLDEWLATGVAAWVYDHSHRLASSSPSEVVTRAGQRAFMLEQWLHQVGIELDRNQPRVSVATFPHSLLDHFGVSDALAPLRTFLNGRPVTRALIDEAYAADLVPNFVQLARFTGRRGLPGIRHALGEDLNELDRTAMHELAGLERSLRTLPTETERNGTITQRHLRRARTLGFTGWSDRKWVAFADSPTPMRVIQESLGTYPARNLTFEDAGRGLIEYAREHFGDVLPGLSRALVDAASAERRTWSYTKWVHYTRTPGVDPTDAIHAALNWPVPETAKALEFEAAAAGLRSFAETTGLPANQRTLRAAAHAQVTWSEDRWHREGYPTVEAIWTAAGGRPEPVVELSIEDALRGLSEFAAAHELPINQPTIRAARAAGASWAENRWNQEVGKLPAVRALIEAYRSGEPIDFELLGTMSAARAARIARGEQRELPTPDAINRGASPSSRG